MEEVKGELTIMDTLGIKPNYCELSRKYGIDRRTIKRYHLGYEGKPKNKNKSSKLDIYLDEIIQKINLTGATIKGTYKYFQKKYNDIGSLQIEDAIQNGAKIITGGGTYTEGELANGWFIQPTVIVNLINDMKIVQKETFGPIVRILKFHSIDEAIELANDSEYGLGSSVITQNEEIAKYIASKLDTGMVWINEPLLSNEYCPWIARKNSGIGYELGIKEFVKLKIINSQFSSNDILCKWWYPYE